MARPTKHTILSDIAPELATETVTISTGKELQLEAVPNRIMSRLFFRFPKLANFKQRPDGQPYQASTDEALELLEAMPAIIAAGLGYPGDEDIEAAMGRLPLVDQDKLVSVTMRISMPREVEGTGEAPLETRKPSNATGETSDLTSP